MKRFRLRCPALKLFTVAGGCGCERGNFGVLFAIDNAVLVRPTSGCEREVFELVSQERVSVIISIGVSGNNRLIRSLGWASQLSRSSR